MRSVDLALYADMLAARAATLAAQVERSRDRLRQAAIERRARAVLDPESVARLERLGLLVCLDLHGARSDLVDRARSLAALHRLQAWVESELASNRDDQAALREGGEGDAQLTSAA
jgi:hypothetical protein